jgi:NTE family protein
MAERGVDVGDADCFVGTSAGARVAVQISCGASYRALCARIGESVATEQPPAIDWEKWRNTIGQAKRQGGSPQETRRRIGMQASQARAEDDASRRRFVGSELPTEALPLLIRRSCKRLAPRRVVADHF